MCARLAFLCLLLATLAGCAGVDSRRAPDPEPAVLEPGQHPGGRIDDGRQTGEGERIAAAAELLVGSPYRFGGSGPREFDCSGLVFYLHRGIGVDVPRTAGEQFARARRLARDELQPGDLVFFRDGGADVTHVGVYVGDARFVHAPKSGRPVSYAGLDEDYFSTNYAGAGRLR